MRPDLRQVAIEDLEDEELDALLESLGTDSAEDEVLADWIEDDQTAPSYAGDSEPGLFAEPDYERLMNQVNDEDVEALHEWLDKARAG